MHTDASTTTLHWIAVHAARGAAVLHSTVNVWMPPGVDAERTQVRLPSTDGQARLNDRAAVVQQDTVLADGQPLDISVSIPTTLWRPPTTAKVQKQSFLPPGIFCAGVLVVIIVMGLVLYLVLRYAPRTSTGRQGDSYDGDDSYDSNSNNSDQGEGRSWSSRESGASGGGSSSVD